MIFSKHCSNLSLSRNIPDVPISLRIFAVIFDVSPNCDDMSAQSAVATQKYQKRPVKYFSPRTNPEKHEKKFNGVTLYS